MKDFERIIIMPKSNFPDTENPNDMICYFTRVMKLFSRVDDHIVVKGSCEQAVLKNKKFNQFRTKPMDKFVEAISEQIQERNGTSFLIFKN